MQFTPTTVYDLFCSPKVQYVIPVYQRAYSWEKEQWKTFLDDLIEQIQGENNYFYGNILLETISKGQKFEIIDGQQRMTTLVIFFRALANELLKREKAGEDLSDVDFDYTDCCEVFLKQKSNVKLRPVQYDRAFFDNYIIDDVSDTPSTTSQGRMKSAKDYFANRLAALPTQVLKKIFEKINETGVSKIELEGKKEAALMFELQNNRGKELTNMEKLKSYLMYQLYVYSEMDDIEGNIEYVTNLYEQIYSSLNALSDIPDMDEDRILVIHCQAWINEFNYRTIEEVKSSLTGSSKKVDWIKQFVYELSRTFDSMKLYFDDLSREASRLKDMKPGNFVYPFIVKGYHYLQADRKQLARLFNTLSVIDFRDKLVNTRAIINSRLNLILRGFDGDVDKLVKEVKDKFSSEYYWSDDHVYSSINGYMYYNPALNCILSEYEAKLQNKGYKLAKMIESPTIEHIAPQTPNDSKLEKGYEVDDDGNYSEEFVNNYLNALGNLLYISQSHNSSIGNKPFADKLKSYNDNPLFNQQAEIKEFIDESKPLVWDSECIKRRGDKIIAFCMENWSFENI